MKNIYLHMLRQACEVHKTGAKNCLEVLGGLRKGREVAQGNFDTVATVAGHLQDRLRDLAQAESAWLALYEGRECLAETEKAFTAAFPIAGQRERAFTEAREACEALA